MRMHPFHEPEWYHKYQHVYAPFLFSFMTLAKVFAQDVEIITKMRLYHIDATCRYGSWLNRARFWSMKLISMVYMLALPVYFQGLGKGLLLFVVGHLTCGEVGSPCLGRKAALRRSTSNSSPHLLVVDPVSPSLRSLKDARHHVHCEPRN